MGQSGFNIVDIIVFGGMALSGYLAYKRGLVREILSLGTWLLAAIITMSFYPLVKPWVAEHVNNQMAVDAASAIGLFCLTIVALVPIGNYLTSLIKGPTLTSIDQSLGFVFGVLRGFLILSLLYLCATFLWPEGDSARTQPDWLTQARTKPLLAYGVDLMKAVIPLDEQQKAEDEIRKNTNAAEEKIQDAQRLEKMSTPVPAAPKSPSDATNYGDDERNKIKDLIDRKVTP
jgi:membrane protein required for colicin V production